MARRPHKLELYAWSVQHPPAEVAFLLRAHAHYNRDTGIDLASRLRDDFCGGAAIAAEFVSLDENHRAVGVDRDWPTIKWGESHWPQVLGERSQDLILLCADVIEARTPKVDLIAAMNFGTFEFHERSALLNYFKSARRTLRPGGLLVIDAFGGPGSMQVKTQSRRVTPPEWSGLEPFTYLWEQRRFDAVQQRIDCRIHFEFSDGKFMRDAFRYDWRMWSLAELTELMREAGFTQAEVWCDAEPATKKSKRSSAQPVRQFSPVNTLVNRDEWVAYVVGHVAPGRPQARALQRRPEDSGIESSLSS